MSGPHPATGPCPHGVVDDVCWRCTPDDVIVREAGRIIQGDSRYTGRVYAIIGDELHRIAAELEQQLEVSPGPMESLTGAALPPEPVVTLDVTGQEDEDDEASTEPWGPGAGERASDYEGTP